MNMKKEKLKKYQELAYHLAIYKTGNVEAAKDIASQTINLFLLKEDSIQNIEPWIVSTCYNYCNQYYKTQQNDARLKEKLRKNVIEMMSNQKSETNIELYAAYQKTLTELSEEDIKIILFYHYCKQNAKKMAELIQKFETILNSDSAVYRKKMNPSDAITLQFMTDFESVKDFVYCGDVHLGRIEDTKGICSKHLMITDNKLEIPLVYNPDFIQLADIDVDKYKTREWLPYIRSMIVTMKLDEIAKLVVSKSK